jgi:hypothetical protein
MKPWCLCVVLLAAVALLAAAPARAQTAAVLEVVLASQTPFPAEPGSTVDVEVELQNNGLADAAAVTIEASPASPFSLIQSEGSSKTFNRVTAKSSVKTDFDIRIDSSAASGDYELEFRVYMGGNSGDFVSHKVKVRVQGLPKLVLGDIATDPENIEPGGTVAMSIPVQNIGTGSAKQLQMTLLSNFTEIVPILSKGSVYVGDLPASGTSQAEIEMGIDRNAEYRIYLATVYATYRDESNTQHADSFTIGIPVSGNIQIDVIKAEPNFDAMTFDVEVANKGTADANSMEAKLVVGGETVDVDYTSQLKATRKTTFSFPLAKDGLPLKGIGQLVMSYTGPDLRKYETTKELSLDFAPQGGSAAATAIIVLAVAVAGYLAWRRFLRKKRKRPEHLKS